MKLNGFEIISISSAVGWTALFATQDYKGLEYSSLSSWAIVKDENGQCYYTGIYPVLHEMSGEIACTIDKYFIGYVHESNLDWPDEEEIRLRIEVKREISEEDANEINRQTN